MQKAFLGPCIAGIVFILWAGCSHKNEIAQQESTETVRPAPAPAPADDRPVIVAFGDSLTAGLGVDPRLSYPAILEQQLAARGHHYRVVNAGVSGDTTGGGLTRVDSVLAYKPRIVILALGANDGLRGLPVETTKTNLEQIIQVIQRAGAKVVLAGMTLPPNYGPEYVRSFEQVFVDLSKKYNSPRIPFLLEGVAAVAGRMQSDGLHPNAAGHKIIAGTVMRVLEPLL